MMTVLRVEHRDTGRGPYRSMAIGCRSLDDQPVPSSDGIDTFALGPHHHFGFPSLDHLTKWFDGHERLLLRKQGFTVRKYAVPPECVLTGRKQVVFDSAVAQRIEEMEIPVPTEVEAEDGNVTVRKYEPKEPCPYRDKTAEYSATFVIEPGMLQAMQGMIDAIRDCEWNRITVKPPTTEWRKANIE